ncbi:putative LRR receptor-like serine/threonine-protein kinase At1g51880 isoform X2 [Carex rostrata]
MVLWRIILLLIFAVTIHQVHSQLDSNGFLSIDCGLSVNSSYIDSETKLTYVSDEQFIDTGVTSQISSSYIISNSPLKELETVRSFPTGIRNCYTLRSMTVGFKYLIRATFYYANYDNLNKPPTFDIYLGIDFWDTVETFNDGDTFYYHEIIVLAAANYIQVCLVNKNLGNPFISSLHLRQLNSKIYQFANATQSLILVERKDLGGSKDISYPQDKYDRWWFPETLTGTIDISTNSTLVPDVDFEPPSVVMQTAATTSSILKPLNINWTVDNKSTTYYWILHFYEIQPPLIGRREFDTLMNGKKVLNEPTIPQTSHWTTIWWRGVTNYNISLVATSNSTLPPLLNAYELYKIAPVGVTGTTYSADDMLFLLAVAAINSIKQDHQIKKGWSGDPCLPKEFIWTGVSCTSNLSNIIRITSLNLSSSGLTGPLSSYFGNLNALVSLDLSSNDLSGSLPTNLDQLTALTHLDIRGNSKISTTLPLGLQKKVENGSLTYMYADINPTSSGSSKKTIIIIIPILLLVIIAVVVATVCYLRKKNKQSMVTAANDHAINYENIPQEGNPNGNYAGSASAISNQPKEEAQGIPNINNRQFSYNDIKRITNDFKNNIGTGGFGSVYSGYLENGLQVAIKVLSQSSTQGVREFMAEAENLTRVHHRNLVSLRGYCTDKSCMALVYEYMQGGNLHDKLKDNEMPLSWKQRLRIAYESALGLEYLHKACNPPLIHRDIKTSNILLNSNLEAKIADFGLSRAFDSDATTHVSTRIVGTPGYLDPEYYLSNQISAKSDVYSFGVVMLEIITGRTPIIKEGGNLVQWVHQKLSGGDIESIVDTRMQEKYDINSVWKVTELACRCTEPTSSQRPTMSAVVAELKESMDFEMSMEEVPIKSTTNLPSDVSQDSSTFEMTYMDGKPTIGPSVR